MQRAGRRSGGSSIAVVDRSRGDGKIEVLVFAADVSVTLPLVMVNGLPLSSRTTPLGSPEMVTASAVSPSLTLLGSFADAFTVRRNLCIADSTKSHHAQPSLAKRARKTGRRRLNFGFEFQTATASRSRRAFSREFCFQSRPNNRGRRECRALR
jgi:hypothetical protein